jgi:glutaredoxin
VLVGKEKCNQCTVSKNLVDEKEIRYHYLDMLEMPHTTMTYLTMYCRSYPMVLSANCFSTFNETLEHFNTI